MRAIPTWLRFVGWMIGVPFLLGGVAGLFSGDFLSGTLTIVFGVSFIPQTRVYIYKQVGLDPSLGVRIVLRLAIMMLIATFSSMHTESQNDDTALESSIPGSSNDRTRSTTDNTLKTDPSAELTGHSTKRFGLTLEERKEYYFKSFDISQLSRIEIQQNHPDIKLLMGGSKRQTEHEDRLRERYDSELRKRYKITAEDAERINLEGIENMWKYPDDRPDPAPQLLIGMRYTLHDDAKLYVASLQRDLLDNDWFTPIAFERLGGLDGYLVKTPYGEAWFNNDQLGRLYGKLTRIGMN